MEEIKEMLKAGDDLCLLPQLKLENLKTLIAKPRKRMDYMGQ